MFHRNDVCAPRIKNDDKQPCSLMDRSRDQCMDEGFCNNTHSVFESSQTFVKTVYPGSYNTNSTEAVGQPVPVIITNRNPEPAIERTPLNATQQSNQYSVPMARKEASSRGKLLLIGH